MKQPFDNVGFAQVQASTISLDATALQATVQQIRSNFAQWMKDTFELSASQQEQLDDLDPAFRQDLADAVADSWAVRHPILFYKEEDGTAKAAKERSVKDIILGRDQQKAQSVQSASVHTHEAVSIQIVYR